MPNIVLINPFEVREGQEKEFLRHWQAAAAPGAALAKEAVLGATARAAYGLLSPARTEQT